ncbi:glucosamine-6-phosphate deaminase [Clostridium vincentii]|uniref:Glucosamine-6-phosphate deaminase n=1 Tax=Clostridium vincentii TaxID=52704 RepID=A0A2T0BAI9_9CLOT|nr:glucosamine-6-phosphate deaminase [Clostridium vincentii]PRR80916.1 Glucosamine-6-phosphate deaminase 1 [Clostridium vincentii]
MKLIVTKDYETMSVRAAEEIAKIINNKPDAVVGLATGSTPFEMYKELIKMNKQGTLDFSKVTTINLDEYIGLSPQHPQSYRFFMDENLFDHINIDKKNTFLPNGLAKNVDEEGKTYDNMIDSLGGTDIQLLGIGKNGHIAFNEPDEKLIAGTHMTKLTESTIKANARFFNSIEEVPKTAVTMGLGQIMKAKKILLIASGIDKAEAIKGLMSGKINTSNPSTMLQMHNDVILIADEDAVSLL